LQLFASKFTHVSTQPITLTTAIGGHIATQRADAASASIGSALKMPLESSLGLPPARQSAGIIANSGPPTLGLRNKTP